MNKYAEIVKTAEVRGCIAAFVDADLVKIGSEEEFDTLCDIVSDNIDNNYTVEKIAETVDNIINDANENYIYKTASDKERSIKAALGDLLLLKTAGEIDNNTFINETNALIEHLL